MRLHHACPYDRPRVGVGLTGHAVLLLTLGATAPACNWTTFADDAKKAPVGSVASPGNFNSKDFGRSLWPLSDGQGKAAAFMATSLKSNTMALLTMDAGGGVGNRPIAATNLDDTEESEITSLVEVPGTSPPRLVLGTPKIHNVGYGRIYNYVLSPDLDGTANTLVVPSLPAEEPGLGRGLAAGRLGGAEGMSDVAVATDDHLVVLVDGLPTNVTTSVTGACDVILDVALDPRYRVWRPMLTSRWWADPVGPTIEQLALGSPRSGTVSGKVSFFSVTGDGTAPNPFTLNCLATLSGPGSTPRFGASLASGDFNGDGVADLLVGAPRQEAFVFLGPFPAGMAAPITISDPTGGDFGYAVAALNLDGKPGDEALIGDPQATVGSQENAGRVTAYNWDAATMTMKSYKSYEDHSPAKDAGFGSTVNVLKVCTDSPLPAAGVACSAAARILMIGAENEVFVYYREGANIPLRERDGKMIPDVRGP